MGRSSLQERSDSINLAHQGAFCFGHVISQSLTSHRDVWLDRARLLFHIAIYYYLWQLMKRFVVLEVEALPKSKKIEKALDKKMENSSKEQQNTEEGQGEEEQEEEVIIPDTMPDDALFISLTLPKKIQRKGVDAEYTSNDPDWRAIVTFMNDPKAREKVNSKRSTLQMTWQYADEGQRKS